ASTMSIRTTHVGSLPRPADLLADLIAEDRGEPVEPDLMAARLADAVEDAVARQVAAGVDIVSDGEMSKFSYTAYLRHRLSGFAPAAEPSALPADLATFPGVAADLEATEETAAQRLACTGPVAVKDRTPLQEDLRNLRAAVAAHRPHGAFMNAASPGVAALFMPDRHYGDEDAYLAALADVLRDEYGAIVNAGFDLQIDAPDLAMGRHTGWKDADLATFRRAVGRNVAVLNAATAGIPAERMRLHLCWGNYPGPHTHDVALDEILDLILGVRPRALLFEAANPRHAHEHAVWAARRAEVPEDMVLVPGVIDTNTNGVEHPELVAERLLRFTAIVGRERVMAGTDCGFATIAARPPVHPDLVWEKLAAQRAGADLAASRA
ncbi:MAG: cobalamin-independent methionine synthase II family protein, partial [Pseudomonadota bacterium]